MNTITKETVMAVNKYHEKYPGMTQAEIAALCKCSPASVGNILNGMYKHLLEEEKKVEDKGVKSFIPYEEYKELVTCELVIDEIFSRTIKSNIKQEDYADGLFIDFRWLFGVLKRYFPKRYEKKVKELWKTEE